MAFILSVLGVVLILEGIPYFAFPAKVKEWSLAMQDIPPKVLRILGLASMGAGLFLLFVIRYLGS
ncbi:MAG: DUF2065 domain-containing protein [Deltaproteobacteria bacterium]|nr:DUF2065 domain-containing protein [Deltaproteobacteria bacterium]